jgi:cell division septation protein DedD
MSRNDPSTVEGNEFEMVLGNKQLLSVFFIVVVLLAVFFTMGYVLGRNSAPVDSAGKGTETPYERRNAPSAVPANSSAANRVAETPVSIAEAQPTASAQNESAPATAAQTIQPAASARQATETAPVTVSQPQPGQTYVQVTAVGKAEADVLAEVLARKGFRTLVAAGPNEKLFRVLVGPAKDINEVAKLKTDLEAATGLKNTFVRKY